MNFWKPFLLVAAAVLWVMLSLYAAVGHLPHRPDSAAYSIGQTLLLPGFILSSRRVSPSDGTLRSLGHYLMAAAGGAVLVAVFLFSFGGYRAAAIAGP